MPCEHTPYHYGVTIKFNEHLFTHGYNEPQQQQGFNSIRKRSVEYDYKKIKL